MEASGIPIKRIALRAETPVIDPVDLAEKEKTEYVLSSALWTLWSLSTAFIASFSAQPFRTLRALRTALTLSRKSDRALPYHIIYFFEACRLLEILKASAITHLHVHFGTNAAELALLVKVLGGPPYSLTIHGSEEFDRPQEIHLPAKLNGAEFVVGVSSYCRSQLYRWAKHDQWPKIKVVHCGLEQAFFQRPVTPIPDVPTLVCVGRLCEQKGQLLLIEAVKILKARKIPVNLVLAGDGEMRPAIEKMIQQYQLESSVRITGWVSNAVICEEIIKSRGMVLPSFAEGLPVAIMEAMALNRPVITSAITGIPELVLNGKCGWLCTAGSVDDLVEAMQACLTMPLTQLTELVSVGRQRVIERHSIDTEVKKLAALFKQSHARQGE